MPTVTAKRGAPPIASAILADNAIAEMVVSPVDGTTSFSVFENGSSARMTAIKVAGQDRRPYAPGNNLLRHGVIQFASEPLPYGSEADLITHVQSFIHRYVDVSPLFETVATYYVLLSWVYDAFNELPYLRVRGDFGSGKSRFLQTVGSVCYKPIFASGASTVSPLFRIIDAFAGTLVMDESDFRFSDQTAEIIKILNNGNARGFPVLRSEATGGQKEYDPRAYAVYGPKIIATRGMFEDRALESRCITEDLGLRPVRNDIPISLPDTFHAEALELRNKLLMYRFRNRFRVGSRRPAPDRDIEPRLAQVFAPLLSLVEHEAVAKELRDLARASSRQLVTDRGMDTEGQLLDLLHGLMPGANGGGMALGDITQAFVQRHGHEYEQKVGPRWVGGILRNRLQLRPVKRRGVYVLPADEYPKLRRLFERYGIGQAEISADGTTVDVVDEGDVSTEAGMPEDRV